MPFFVKRPIVIEARQWPEIRPHQSNIDNRVRPFQHWMGEAYARDDYHAGVLVCEIDTIEGTMSVQPGDWIIKGVEGEFYPCKDSVFQKTYEPVSNDAKKLAVAFREARP